MQIAMRTTFLLAILSTATLCAQPPISYSTYFGGRGGEAVHTVAADSVGNTYLAGNTSSVGEPFGSDPAGWSSGEHGFLAKLDPSGQLVFAKTIPGSRLGVMAVDPEGNSYLAGSASQTGGFQTTPQAFQTTTQGGGAFVMKIDPSGSPVFSTYLGGRGSPTASAVVYDSERNVIACGSGRAGDIPLTADAIQDRSSQQQTQVGFCSVLSPDGSQLRFSTLVGGSGNTRPSAVAIDEAGDLVVTGHTDSADFPFKDAFQQGDPRRTLFRFNRDDDTWSSVGDHSLGGIISIGFTATGSTVLGADRGPAISSDEGRTWSFMPGPAGPVAAHPRNPNYMCTILSAQLWCTRNGGREWRWEGPSWNRVTHVIAEPKIDGGFYVAADSRLLQMSLASSSGRRWDFELPLTSFAVDVSGQNTIWAVSVGALYRSRDGVGPFERIGSDRNFQRVFVSPQWPGVLYATALNRPGPWLRRSEDGGDTWSDVKTAFDPGTIRDFAIDPRSPATVFVATWEGVFRSQDFGETWTLLSAGLTNGLVRTLGFDPAGNLWAGTVGASNGFLAKLNMRERAIQFATLVTGSGGAGPLSIKFNSAGQILVLGRTASTDLPLTAEPFLAGGNPYGQSFLAIFEPNGSLVQLRMIGLNRPVMAIDGLGRLHLAGSSHREPGSGAPLIGNSTGGGSDGIWTVLDLETGAFAGSAWLGGSGTDGVTALAIGPDGVIRLAGSTTSDDFPLVNALQPQRGGMTEAFVVATPLPPGPEFIGKTR